ncbi:MAG: ribonuclease P [Thermoplasmata archaeon]|nr:MAG: ribonuclease P [Thermoplasmata archaeon]
MARRGRGRRTKEMVVIARERMELLMEQADQAALAGQMDLADRYVDLARRVGMRYNVRFRQAHRRRFCKACYRYLLPGSTSRTRMNRGRAVTTCLRCGHVMRRPLGDGGVGHGQ